MAGILCPREGDLITPPSLPHCLPRGVFVSMVSLGVRGYRDGAEGEGAHDSIAQLDGLAGILPAPTLTGYRGDPCTLHLTLGPKPYTLNSSPSPLNPKAGTLNLEP